MPKLVRGKDGICYDSKEMRGLFEGTAMKLEMTVQEVSRFVFKELLMPRAEVLEEMFTEFEEVPGPGDDVDLDETFARMRRDDNACERIMLQNPGNWLVCEVMRVQLAWLRFAAVRWPTADGRKAFNAMMELQQVAIGVLIARAEAPRSSAISGDVGGDVGGGGNAMIVPGLGNLLCFPCAATKSPLARSWPRDAKRIEPLPWWPLVGVPTGDVSGFDVLDVDPDGLDWLRANEDWLPATRRHQTPRGWHILFKHAKGLRNSGHRIAKGVDVRANGGYVIWWPRQGYGVTNGEAL